MDMGTAIAISSGVLGVVAIIFRIFPRQEKVVTTTTTGAVAGHCPSHSGVTMSIENMTDWLNKIEAKLDRVIERRERTRDGALYETN